MSRVHRQAMPRCLRRASTLHAIAEGHLRVQGRSGLVTTQLPREDPNGVNGNGRKGPIHFHHHLACLDVGTPRTVLHTRIRVPLPWSAMSGFDWKTASAQDVDFQYSPSKFAKRPLAEYLAEYASRSADVDLASLRQKNTPLLIFIHGGYWQSLSAADSLYNGPKAAQEGVAFHAVDYTLAPDASIEEIVNECIADVKKTIAELNPTSVVIAGSSAGAHLTAMCARDEEISSRINGVALLSGVYDLRPLVCTSTNDPLHLTLETAADVSPQLLPLTSFAPQVMLAVGRHEPPEFIRQNAEYAETLVNTGVTVTTSIVEDRDHFDLPYDLLQRGTQVGDWCLNILKGTEQ